jgi:5-hydroxyisourate hydrolase-like protein (transthyretin family)
LVSAASISYTKNSLTAGKTKTTITAGLISSGAAANNVKITMRLLNANSQAAAQKIYNNQNLKVNSSVKYSLTTPKNLPAGNYTIAITVNNPDNSQLASLLNLGTITVK